MCHNRFTIQIDLFKYKRFKDGGCAYKNTGSSHLKLTVSTRSSKLDSCFSKPKSPSQLFLSRSKGFEEMIYFLRKITITICMYTSKPTDQQHVLVQQFYLSELSLSF